MTDQPPSGSLSQTHKSGQPREASQAKDAKVWFDRRELALILGVYGRLVAAGECRDYAIGAYSDHTVFNMHRHASEAPSWVIEKRPELARRQGAYSVVNATGQILKRGHDLAQVLRVFDRKRFEVVE